MVEEGDAKHTADPADGVGNGEGDEVVGDKIRHHEEVDLAQADEAGEHGDHRDDTPPLAAKSGGKDLIEDAGQIEGGQEAQKARCHLDDARVGVEDGGERRSEDHNEKDQHARDAKADADGVVDAATRTAVVADADVLPDEGGDGEAKRLNGQEEKLIDLRVGGEAAEVKLLIAVRTRDVALHEDVGKGGDGHLERGREADEDDLFEHIRMDMQAAHLDAHDGIGGEQLIDDEGGGHRLCKDGGEGNAAHAEPKGEDEDEIQHHVDHGADHEVIEGAARVADGAQNARARVVDHQARDAQKVDDEIVLRIAVNIARRVAKHHFEDRGGEEHADHGEEHA